MPLLPGHEADPAEKLADAAVVLFQGLVAGDGYSQIREAQLREAMSLAHVFAESMDAFDADPARRRGAAAAVMLIQNSPAIFLDFPRLPKVADGEYEWSDFRVAAAWMLAETFAERTGGSRGKTSVNLIARGGLKSTIEQIIADYDQMVANHSAQEDDEAPLQLGSRSNKWFAQLASALADYHGMPEQRRLELEAFLELDDCDPASAVDDDDLSTRPSANAGTDDRDLANAPSSFGEPAGLAAPVFGIGAMPADAVGGVSGTVATPAAAAAMTSGRRWGRRGTLCAAIAAAVGAGIVLGIASMMFMVWAFPSTSRAMFAMVQARESTDEVIASQVLPDTEVELFLIDHGTEDEADTTVAGVLPTASPASPNLYDTVSFKLVLSAPEDVPSERNSGLRDLQLSIGATSPLIIKNAAQTTGASNSDWPASKLDSQPLTADNGPVSATNPPIGYTAGTAIIIPHPAPGAPTIITFEAEAHPDGVSNGYMCGFNAKSVQVMVRRALVPGEPEDGLYAITPYPLYVGRWKGC